MKYIATLNDIEANFLDLKTGLKVYSIIYSDFVDLEIRILTMEKLDINSNRTLMLAFKLGTKTYWQFDDENIRRV